MLCAFGLLAGGCQSTDANRPTIWPAGKSPLRVAQPSPDQRQRADQVFLLRGPAPPGFQVTPIATIDSIAVRANDPQTTARQEADLRKKAASIGATAVINISPRTMRTRGFERDPNTPFPAWRLGSGQSTFLRGLAVTYIPPGGQTVNTAPRPQLPPENLTPDTENPSLRLFGGVGSLINR
jgi:hypothetical protein